MQDVYADLHIHIGRAQGKPVKITAARDLTLEAILDYAPNTKGIDLVGIVDCATYGVVDEIERMLVEGKLRLLSGGGYRGHHTTLIPGTEVELACQDGNGAAHFLAYFPEISCLKAYMRLTEGCFTSQFLSTQRPKLTANEWADIVIHTGGAIIAAHAFTPHKGVYGNCVKRLDKMFIDPTVVVGLELGLSSNAALASTISDTLKYSYLTNSDAHSLAKIAREYTIYRLAEISFDGWFKALTGKQGNIVANYGLDPRLGKYYRSYCPVCSRTAQEEPPIFYCSCCGGKQIPGVLDRIRAIADQREDERRPEYVEQTPLQFIPGIGPKAYDRLIRSFGTEMAILHQATEEELAQVVGSNLARLIVLGREGKLTIQGGGGGVYGKVLKS